MNEKQIKQILEDVQHGDRTIDDAMLTLRDLPYEDLGHTKIDHHRALRNGFPEVIYGAGKTPDQVADIFADWCRRTGAAGAVWTDLGGNFEEDRGTSFSVPRAIDYLKTLNGESLIEAVRYIEYAPAATNTPLRRALAKDEWWRAQAAKYC